MRQKSRYAQKRASGNMMYGPTTRQPKYPEFKASYVARDRYWWGEQRKGKQVFLF